jgi:TPR repeat protein
MNKNLFTRTTFLFPFGALALVATIYFGGIGYRSYLINSSLNQYKTTGKFDNEKLKSAMNMKSDYAAHLLLLSYKATDDTLNFIDLKSALENTNDWKSNAILNDVTANEENPSNNNLLEIRSNLENDKIKNDWFWVFMKGRYLSKGINGFEKDDKLSLLHIKQAADLGAVSAMRNYGFTTEDKSEKCTYLEMLVNSNYSDTFQEHWGDAYAELSYLYYTGEGCSLDYNKAFEYSQKSANLNDREGLYILAFCYETGNGTEQDEKLAFDNYLKSADLGDSRSMYKVSQFYKNGSGVEKDHESYLTYLSKAAALNNEDAKAEKKKIQRSRTYAQAASFSYSDIIMNALFGDHRDKNQQGNALCEWCRGSFSGDGYDYEKYAYECRSRERWFGKYCSPRCAVQACNAN